MHIGDERRKTMTTLEIIEQAQARIDDSIKIAESLSVTAIDEGNRKYWEGSLNCMRNERLDLNSIKTSLLADIQERLIKEGHE